jgi:hypothetical protein
MLPKEFKPKHKYNLIRIGRNNDGGYLVEKDSILKSNSLVSFGIGFDWSFEKDFFNYRKIPIHCYDHTLKYSYIKKFSRHSLFSLLKPSMWRFDAFKELKKKIFLYKDYKNFFKEDAVHFRSAIGIGFKRIRLKEIFDRIRHHPIFFKIDIEGSEYRILEEIIELQDFICGIVIEFHDIDLHEDKILNFINNFKLKLVHVHAQNPGGEQYLTESGDPTQLEMTFSNAENFLDINPQIPHNLDQVSDPRFGEIKLYFKD